MADQGPASMKSSMAIQTMASSCAMNIMQMEDALYDYAESPLQNFQEAFFDAIYRYEIDKVESILNETGALIDINVQNTTHKTALFLALDTDHSVRQVGDMVRLLLKHGADVNISSYCSAHCTFEMPVVTAARQKNYDMVELLLEENSELEGCGRSKDGKSALQWAATYGDIPMAKLLYVNGAEVNWIGPYFHSALHYAVLADEKDMVKWLLEHSAEITINGDGRSPLHIATVRGNLPIVQHLIQYKCEINSKDNYQFTPLSLACLRGHLQIIQYMMDNAPPSTEFNVNDGLLRASDCGHIDVLRYLLGKGADVNAVNTLGETALSIAARGQYYSVCLLLESQAKINTVDRRGYTPLQHAIIREQKDIATNLIQHGAHLYSLSETIESPLQMCSNISNPMLMKCMLDAGCDLTREGWFNVQVIEEKLRDLDFKRSMRFHRQVNIQKDIWMWIMERITRPPSLYEAARISARRQLVLANEGRSIIPNIKTLHLPARLKRYIMMEDLYCV